MNYTGTVLPPPIILMANQMIQPELTGGIPMQRPTFGFQTVGAKIKIF